MILGIEPEAAALMRTAGSNVQFIGGVDDVRPYLQAADIFVLVSVVEGLSMSLLGAMSTGLTVIVMAIGGAPDVIDHGYNGLLIPPDDPTALHEALLTLLTDADLRDRLGRARAGRRR